MKYLKLFEEYTQEDYDVKIDIPKTSIHGTYYHGTVLTDGDFISNLSTGYGDFDAIWFSSDENIANDFADNYYNKPNNEAKIIFEVEINSDDIADIDYDLSQEIMEYYGYFDFRESIDMLKQKGFDGWKTIGGIDIKKYDDIAIFDNYFFELKKAKLFINNKWTEYMDIYDIKKIYTDWYNNK
jgi:hypothetical protein